MFANSLTWLAADQRDRCQRCTASHDEVPHITVICQARTEAETNNWSFLAKICSKLLHRGRIISTMSWTINHHSHMGLGWWAGGLVGWCHSIILSNDIDREISILIK